MRIFFILLCAALSFLPAAARAYSPPELEGLLAPIALYPDPAVQDVLTVSIPADPTTRNTAWANLAAYPELRDRMTQSPQWMADLGNAWMTQPDDVMATVQTLRLRASPATTTVVPVAPAVVPYPYYSVPVFVGGVVVRRPAFHPHVRVYARPFHAIPESRRAPIVQSRVGPAFVPRPAVRAPAAVARPSGFHNPGFHAHPGARGHR